MDVSKIIRGIVNSRGYTITSAITQWDYGYVFVPEFEDLPATYRLDFSNDEHHGTALPVYCGSEGGEVPEELIDTGKDIFVWFFYIGDGFGKSEYKWRIPNKCKPKTEQDEPSPSQQSSIDQLIVRSNEAVTSAEQSANEARQKAESITGLTATATTLPEGSQATASYSNGVLSLGIPKGDKGESPVTLLLSKDVVYVPMDREYRTKIAITDKIYYEYRRGDEQIDGIMDYTGTLTNTNITCTNVQACTSTQRGYMRFTIPQGVPLRTNTDTQLVVNNRFVFDYTDLDGNRRTIARSIMFVGVMDGEQGEPGDDGYSPTVTITPITGGHRIAITDVDGTKTADVMDGDDYILTEEDKEEIADIVEVPSDWLKAFPTDTASGAVASFSDGADDLPLKSLIVDINPIQDLSHGDPSPENICPISGWTGVKVTRTGKNLLDLAEFARVYPYYCTYDSESGELAATSIGSLYSNGISVDIPTDIFDGGFLHYEAKNGTCTNFRFRIVYDDGTITEPNGTGTETGYVITTIPVYAKRIVSIRLNWSTSGTFTVKNAYITFGQTETAYEPYNGNTYNISWESSAGTVYGGKLDVLSGELVIDRAMVDLGTLDWGYEPNYNRHGANFNQIPNIKIPGGTIVPNALCSKYKIVSSSTGWANRYTVTAMAFDATFLRVYNDGTADAATYKIAMSGVQLCYELAEPIEIQLSANQINSLYGVNNIWADSGDITAEYRADTKLFIERLTAPDFCASDNIV